MSSNDPHCSAQGLRDTGSIERHRARIGGGWCTREGGNTTRCDEIPGNDSAATARRNRTSIRTRNSLQDPPQPKRRRKRRNILYAST